MSVLNKPMTPRQRKFFACAVGMIRRGEPVASLAKLCQASGIPDSCHSEVLCGLRLRGLLTHRVVQVGAQKRSILRLTETGEETPIPPNDGSVYGRIADLRRAGKTHREVGAEIGLSPAAVAARVSRASRGSGPAIGFGESPVGRRAAAADWPAWARFDDMPADVLAAEADRLNRRRLPPRADRFDGSLTGNAARLCAG